MNLESLLGNIPVEEQAELMKLAQENPMAAMAKLQGSLSPDMLETILGMVMSNPDLLKSVQEQSGFSDDQIQGAMDSFADEN
jgi:hypothetical protein